MELPDLPKKLNKKEAKITPAVLKWFEDHYPYSCALEIKVGKNKVLDHQLIALKQVADGTFSYKIPDTGRRNPFDAVVLQNAKAFIITCDATSKDCMAVDVNGDWFKFNVSEKKKPR